MRKRIKDALEEAHQTQPIPKRAAARKMESDVKVETIDLCSTTSRKKKHAPTLNSTPRKSRRIKDSTASKVQIKRNEYL